MKRIRLRDIAYARSGDKGDISNIGVIAKDGNAWKILDRHLTAAVVKEYFGTQVKGDVARYDLPNVQALNFVLRNALGGGATRSLQRDFTGKNMGQALLLMELEVPENETLSV